MIEKTLLDNWNNLSYSYDDLDPYMSRSTLEYHHGKHHKAYLDFVVQSIKENTSLGNKGLVEIINLSYKESTLVKLYNNASQVYNHQMFWNCMSKVEKGVKRAPQGQLLDKIVDAFGSLENFHTEFLTKSMSVFGSGWVWLMLNKEEDNLEIVTCPNGNAPVTDDSKKPVLGCDVWEHSYYLDYQNRRAEYVTNFLEYLVNWETVSEHL